MAALTCWLAWSGPSILLTLSLLPLTRGGQRFAAGLALWTAGSERGLLRATARELRALPGAGRGKLHIDASGDPTRSARQAAVTLTATRRGARIQGASLEQSPRTGRPWQPCPPDTELQPGMRYRTGELYLLLD
jgi:hypothetical protein